MELYFSGNYMFLFPTGCLDKDSSIFKCHFKQINICFIISGIKNLPFLF